MYKTELMEHSAIRLEKSEKAYNGSRLWFHVAICPSTRTSAVFATVVSGLESKDTVTKRFLFRKGYFLMFGTLTARRTERRRIRKIPRN